MNKIYAVAKVLLFALILSSCARKMTMTSASIVPGASGSVKVKKDNNNNYAVTVNVVNLAEPKELTPPRNVYVVWMDTDENFSKNIGQIKTSSSLLSKALKGEFKTTSPSKPNKVYITAEDDGNVQSPGATRVLSTD